MGHFSFTCSISGLAITGGTPVRCLLLTSSPYSDDDTRNSWVVRTPPIRAKYNEYGSIEDINKEDEFTANLWLRGLREDIVEKGMGDNQCHDVPTSKDMTFDQLLEALWERRVEVMQDVRHFWRRPMLKDDLVRIGDDDIEPTEPLDRSAPMYKRIERLLKARDKRYVVDEPVPNLVRVRFGQHLRGEEHRKGLEHAKHAVQQENFVAVIAAGSGRYADHADLLVMNPPSEDQHFKGAHWDMASGQKSADDKRMSIRLAMVREDVWQALITYPQSKGVYIDCTTCGQQSFYHEKNRECPNKSINKKPLKPHKKGSTYTHGPVFSAEVEHLVLTREYGETVWYGLDAFKVGVRSAWKKIRDYFDKQDRRSRGETVEEDEDEDENETPSGRRSMDKLMRKIEAARKKEDERIAALPEAERLALEATRKAEREAWEAREKERRDNPIFGDYLITDGIVPRGDDLGSWAFHSELPGVLGIPDHLSMCLADKLEVPERVIDSLAELMAVRYAMGAVGAVWKPASSTGPQDPEWAEYVRFNETLVQISKKEARRREEKEPLPVTLGEAFKRFAPPPKTAVKPSKKVKKKR
jgi:hypothetical protein